MASNSYNSLGVSELFNQNTYYIVSIASSFQQTVVHAWMPEEIVLSIESYWQFCVGQGVSPWTNLASQALFGESPNAKWLTAQQWVGWSPLKLQLPLQFFAINDPVKEVIEPIKSLIKMMLPRGAAVGLTPPGPRAIGEGIAKGWFGNGTSSQDQITVYIGNFIRIPTVFVQSMPQISFKGKLTSNGLPIEGACSFWVSTLYSPLYEDIDLIIGNGVGNVAPGTLPTTNQSIPNAPPNTLLG